MAAGTDPPGPDQRWQRVAQAAAASGLSPADAVAAWREWSAGQRALHRAMPDLTDRTAEYDAVEAILDARDADERTGGVR